MLCSSSLRWGLMSGFLPLVMLQPSWRIALYCAILSKVDLYTGGSRYLELQGTEVITSSYQSYELTNS